MASELNLKKFNRIYNDTYDNTLKFVVIRCQNIDDVNDILQETYLELWKIINKKQIEEKNIKSFILSIAINKVKKHYSLIYKLNTLSVHTKTENDSELIESIESKVNIEDLVIKDDEWMEVWKYVKDKKDKNIAKVFYLYYKLEMSIKEIAKELNKSESYVKNIIYRTLKELCSSFRNEV